jgi:hypothetical protein
LRRACALQPRGRADHDGHVERLDDHDAPDDHAGKSAPDGHAGKSTPDGHACESAPDGHATQPVANDHLATDNLVVRQHRYQRSAGPNGRIVTHRS